MKKRCTWGKPRWIDRVTVLDGNDLKNTLNEIEEAKKKKYRLTKTLK